MTETSTESRPRAGAPARAAVATGVVLAAAALVDQLAGHWTARDSEAHYAPLGTVPDPTVLTTLMAVSALVFAACMYPAVRQARRGRHVLAALTSGACALTWGAVAAVASLAYEYGDYVLSPAWRLGPWLLPLAALVAAVRSVRALQAPGA
ncbi:hypothetical protein [uncultured Actinomyces sp.]|uniref:hypothetical protein n=1 Tax=uncultured Actinomyces sp. TaxID=249061 RepID=UPI0028EEB305|nr:hypothetical protein [uncultured Actinomyces sp.]